jgi:hypothetical protein
MERNTKLTDLSLPYIDVILHERFLLPPKEMKRLGLDIPQTIGDLVDQAGTNLESVKNILQECMTLSKGIILDIPLAKVSDVQETEWILDVRPNVDFDSEPLHPNGRIFHLGNRMAQIEIMKTLHRVIVISDEPGHAWSAAMALRKEGVSAYVCRVN